MEKYRNLTMEMTAEIISAYVSKNNIPSTDLQSLIHAVHATLKEISASPAPTGLAAPKTAPAVPIMKSIAPDFLVCLEDGRTFKSLKRHLRTAYGLSPEHYREKWSLPKDYPMVAPNYAAARSALAKASGLGQMRRSPLKSQAPAAAKPQRKSVSKA